MRQEGLASTLTLPLKPAQPTPTMIEQLRAAVMKFATPETPPQPSRGPTLRDVRPGKNLDAYLKEQGIN